MLSPKNIAKATGPRTVGILPEPLPDRLIWAERDSDQERQGQGQAESRAADRLGPILDQLPLEARYYPPPTTRRP